MSRSVSHLPLQSPLIRYKSTGHRYNNPEHSIGKSIASSVSGILGHTGTQKTVVYSVEQTPVASDPIHSSWLSDRDQAEIADLVDSPPF